MFWASRVVLLILSVPFAFSQTAQPPPPATGSVEGVVVRADTQEPLKKAWVTMRKEGGKAPGTTLGSLTDATGKFVLSEVEPGRYHLGVERNGYVPRMYGMAGPESAGTILSMSPGQTIRDIRIALTPAGVLTGRVYDDDAEPVVNASVSVLKSVYREGKRELQPRGFSRTNDLGEYRIFGLAPGTYYISAIFTGWDRPPLAAGAGPRSGNLSAEELGYAPTYYPGTPDLGRAIAVEVKPGEELPGLDINLISTQAVRVRGRVLNPNTGKGELRAWVVLVSRESKSRSFMPSAQTMVNNALGEFEFRGIVPGAYTLIASTLFGEEVFRARIPVEVGPSDMDGLVIALGKGLDVSGRVRWEGGHQSSADSKVRVTLRPREEFFMMQGATKDPDPDGTFVLKNIADGEYRVHLEDTPEGCYLKSASLGGEDVLSSGVNISGGKVPGPLEITVNCAGGTVSGTVVGDQMNPVPGVTVVLVPEGERRAMLHLFKSTTTDQYGRFTIKGVAPGEYKAFAWDRMEIGAYQDPEFLRRFESEGKPVTIGEGSKLDIQLSAISTGKPQP